MLGRGKQFLFVSQGRREPGGAEVVRFSHEHRALEIGIGVQLRGGAEDPAAERQILRLELLLQRNRVGGDNQLPRLVHGMDDAGQEVGERLADAGPGFEEQGLIGLHRRRDGARHLFLLRAMFQLQPLVQPASLGEDFGGKLGRATRRRGRGSGVGVVVQANHETESANH